MIYQILISVIGRGRIHATVQRDRTTGGNPDAAGNAVSSNEDFFTEISPMEFEYVCIANYSFRILKVL